MNIHHMYHGMRQLEAKMHEGYDASLAYLSVSGANGVVRFQPPAAQTATAAPDLPHSTEG